MDIDFVQMSIELRVEQSNNTKKSRDCRYGIGCLYDSPVMIIGEVSANSLDLDGLHKCWYNLNKAKSPYFLHAALNKCSKPLNFYLTNVRKSHSLEVDYKLLEQELSTIKPKKIILLGNVAASLFSHLFPEEKFKKIPHPSYIRRFNKMTIEEYSKLIENE
jgi:hypothetical protein